MNNIIDDTVIRIVIPKDRGLIRAAAEYLANLCNCLVEPKPMNESATVLDEKEINFKTISVIGKVTPTFVDGTDIIYDGDMPWNGLIESAAAIFSSISTPPSSETVVESGGYAPPVIMAGGTVPPPITLPTIIGTNLPLGTPAVDLADGIPWDERIHSSSKAKLKSPPYGWKLKKQPGQFATKEAWLSYVADTEKEIRVAVSIPPAASFPTPTPPPVEVPPSANELLQARGLRNDIPPLAPVTMTYAGLTEAITLARIMPPQVQAALGEIELASYPALSNRPDLIPRMAQLLGLVKP